MGLNLQMINLKFEYKNNTQVFYFYDVKMTILLSKVAWNFYIKHLWAFETFSYI